MTGVEISIKVDNFERVEGKLRRFHKAIDIELRKSLSSYFNQDFQPMLSAILTGRKAANVPSKNAPRWAAIKAAKYGINHSLGLLTGMLHASAMSVSPTIRTAGNRTTLLANYGDIPYGDYPYMMIVHEGFDRLQKPYPMVEGAALMTHNKLMQRVNSEISQARDKTAG